MSDFDVNVSALALGVIKTRGRRQRAVSRRDAVFHHAGIEGRVSGPAPGHADYGSFAAFSDPDGNGWLL